MAKPAPTMLQFSDGDDFSTQAVVDKFNENVLRLTSKLGAIVAEDLVTSLQTTFTPSGSIDVRGFDVSDAVSVFSVVNQGISSSNLSDTLANLSPGGTVYIPTNVSIQLTQSVQIPDNCQIIGGGSASVIIASTAVSTAAFTAFIANGTSHWELRNFRLVGKRTLSTGSGAGIMIHDCTHAQGVIENIFMGPLGIGGSVTNAIDGPAVHISGSSDVAIVGCVIRQCDGTGVLINSNGTTASERIVVADNKVFNANGPGIVVDKGVRCAIHGNTLQENSASNVAVHGAAQDTAIFDNTINNAGTNSGGVDDGIYVSGDTGGHNNHVVVMFNHMIESSITARTTKAHVHLHTNSHSNVVYCNWLGSTTGSGYSILANNSTPMARDCNHLHPAAYTVLGFNNGGFDYVVGSSVSSTPANADDKVYRAQWNDTDELVDYQTTHQAAMSDHPARRSSDFWPAAPRNYASERHWLPREGESVITGAHGRHFTPGGYAPPGARITHSGDAQSRCVSLNLDGAVLTFGNPGTPLTPAKIECSSTHIDTLGTRPRELAAVQATYNIVGANRIDPEGPSHDWYQDQYGWYYEPRLGDIFYTRDYAVHAGNTIWASLVRTNDNPRWFFYTTSGVIGQGFSKVSSTYPALVAWSGGGSDPAWMTQSKMGDSVLTAYIKTSIDKSVMVVEGYPSTEILDGRPTWVVMHY